MFEEALVITNQKNAEARIIKNEKEKELENMQRSRYDLYDDDRDV